MVYLALVLLIVISFELSPLSNEFPNEFLLISIFFLRIASLQLFCVFAATCRKACAPLSGFSLLLPIEMR